MSQTQDEPRYEVRAIFGHVELDSRWRAAGIGGLQGQSRKRIYDDTGRLVEVTPWMDTGGVLSFE